MTDTVELVGLRVRGYHGVHAAERRDGQPFVVDAVLTLDTGPAARSDDLADTVDYAALAATLAAVVEGEPANLIETVAHRLADACLADRRVVAVEIRLRKPQAPLAAPVEDVVVTVRKTRS